MIYQASCLACVSFRNQRENPTYGRLVHFTDDSSPYSGPTEVEVCSLPPPNMAATKTGEQSKALFSVL